MMKSSIVPANLLSPRLDAEYYSPSVLELVKSLHDKGHPTLGRLLTTMKRHPMCYGFQQWSDCSEDRIPYFKGEDLYELSLKHGNSFIQESNFDDYESAQVLYGEMIMSVRGTIGRTSVCRNDRGLCSPNTIVLVPKKELDPEFAAAFLSCQQGQILINREISGTVQDTITEDAIRNIQAVRFSPQAQARIGNMVRQAANLRAAARGLERSFSHTIQRDFPEVFGEPKALGRSSLVAAIDLHRDLNPGAYNPERLRVRAEIKKAGGRKLSEVAHIEASVTDSYGPNDDYVGLDSLSSTNAHIVPMKVSQAEVEGSSRILREGPVISKLRPYLNKVSYIPAELANAVGSTELLCIRPNTGVSGWFIYGVLKLPCTLRQFQPVANGSTHPRIDTEDVLEAMVPWHDNADKLGRDLEKAQTMGFVAEKLALTAKLLIEALIEGKVTEVELVNAQEALERGDHSADRALLSRLTRKGIDVAGEPPLFPDLDALYALLAQTEPATE